MKLKAFLFGILCTGLWVSCDQTAILNENNPIDNKAWLYTSPSTFQFHISDNTKKYDVLMDIRHTPEYAFSNLFVLIHQQGPDKKRYTFRKEVKLAKPDGKWTGKSSGSLYNNQTIIHNDYQFPDTGLYIVSIEQHMRENPLKEITDIGLKVIPK
ncbi:gliding motility lipoprotein GldH [Sphingobacterium sp. N143]|uniref:gliding motility lipoprotein GldH n=1 Tax=Sphingobacterium sp. N143 TaxID=2746727 RepID=UPI0025757F6B|nr:gliding motility lipoprotein GldH [Sphingobacterium sp. N143]MDM1296057.1 gliding motility lipoprotein GldH [Sphingobacterium sp. N143]